jgi:hypothetical protein
MNAEDQRIWMTINVEVGVDIGDAGSRFGMIVGLGLLVGPLVSWYEK